MSTDLIDFYSRANLFRSKLEVGLMHVGRGEYDTAHYYIKSSSHELLALQSRIESLQRTGLQPVLVCRHERGNLNFWICVFLGGALAVVLWILRMMRPVKVKLV